METKGVNVRPYEERDRTVVENLVSQLQNHIAEMDEHGIMRPSDEFDGAEHMRILQHMITESGGIILVAESENNIVGCVVGVIVEKKDSAHKAVKSTHIEELVVDSSARSKGAGSALMREIERWARNERCSFIRVDCFSNNDRAHAFYEKLEYKDRYVNMIKALS
jgi:ribosomal protein S18 acetylase RimI-like enzyme